MSRVVAVVLAVVLFAGACSGEATVVGSEPGAETGAVLDVEQVAADLLYLGDLAQVTSSQREVFDGAGGALQLSSDSVVEVPAGAFAAPTELRATEIELVFDRYATGAPRARIYRLSTPDEIELGAPVVLEVDTAPQTVIVMQLVEETWQPVEVPAGDTVRVPIDRFSDVTIAVGERVEDKPIFNNADPRASVANDFLTACLYTVMFLLSDDLDRTGGRDTSLSLQLAYSFCTRALVDKFSPAGVTVEVSCVGDKIEQIEPGRFGLGAAIDACVEEQRASADDTAGSNGADTEDADDDDIAVGSSGLLDYAAIPGPDGTMLREAIILSIVGDAATLTIDLAFRTAVEYVDDEPVCWDDFTMTSGTSNLTVDDARVTGTSELILNFAGATQCPETEQDDIGVPQQVDITGQIDDRSFIGNMTLEGLTIPFSAAVN